MNAITQPIQYKWIINRKQDLVWFIFSALSSYLLIYMFAGLHWDMATIWFFWVMLIDTPHFFGTYSRTYFDKIEYRNRRNLLFGSLGWFLLGPAAILMSYILYKFGILAYQSPWFLFVGFFSLWAYWHVVRQHYGFLMLYKKKNNESNSLDYYLDSTLLYGGLLLPLLVFMIREPEAKSMLGNAIGGILPFAIDDLTTNLPSAIMFLIVAIGLVYTLRQTQIYFKTGFFNLPKNLFLAVVVPLHIFICYSEWTLAAGLLGFGAFVTIFHDLQYHAIIWFHHQNRYRNVPNARQIFGLSSVLGSSLKKYILAALSMGVIFRVIGCTLEVHPGCLPVVRTTGIPLFGDISTNQLLLGFLFGIAMHHYFLDQYIWRTSKDKQLVKDLKLEQ